jgi:DNA-binding beta-propeller fold protein YncE
MTNGTQFFGRFNMGGKIAVLMLGMTLRLSAGQTAPSLSLVADVPLPGNPTRFDYQSLDSRTGILYISHMGDGEVLAFDTRSRKVLARLPGFPSVTGVLAVSELRKVYVSVPGKQEVAIVGMDTFNTVAQIRSWRFPDGLAYAPKAHRVFVSDEWGGQETVIDARTDQKIGTIDLDGQTGNTQLDPVSGHVFATLHGGAMVEIDPGTLAVVGRHPLPGGDHPHGLLIDPKSGLAFVACEGNATLLVLKMRTFRVEQILPTGGDPDVLSFDSGLGRLYVACESGILSVFQLKDGKLALMGNETPGDHCHTVFADPKTHLVYLPLQNVGEHPAMRIMQPAR